MNTLIPGIPGFIGGAVAHHLLRAGHAARGRVGDQDDVYALLAMGITPVSGDLDDRDLLIGEAQRAEALINAGSSDHRRSVAASLGGLHNSGKSFLHANGSGVIGDNAGGNAFSHHIFDEARLFIVDAGKQAL